MKKLLVRYLLSLCILLLSGYSQLLAHEYHISSPGLCERIEQPGVDLGANSASSVKRLAASETQRILFIDAVEGKDEDEHDFISAKKKHLDNPEYYATVFCALTRGYFQRCIQEILPFSGCFSDASPFRRHLILQVFRI